MITSEMCKPLTVTTAIHAWLKFEVVSMDRLDAGRHRYEYGRLWKWLRQCEKGRAAAGMRVGDFYKRWLELGATHELDFDFLEACFDEFSEQVHAAQTPLHGRSLTLAVFHTRPPNTSQPMTISQIWQRFIEDPNRGLLCDVFSSGKNALNQLWLDYTEAYNFPTDKIRTGFERSYHGKESAFLCIVLLLTLVEADFYRRHAEVCPNPQHPNFWKTYKPFHSAASTGQQRRRVFRNQA